MYKTEKIREPGWKRYRPATVITLFQLVSLKERKGRYLFLDKLKENGDAFKSQNFKSPKSEL